jgi:transcriptional regulator with XRE-family HTH domain
MEPLEARAPTIPARGRAAVVVYDRPGSDEPLIPSFHMRNGAAEPTEFGYFLLRAMAAHEPPLKQAELARRVGVGSATISRWIFKDGQPEAEKLRPLAEVLGVRYGKMLTLAGYGEPEVDVAEELAKLRPDLDPLAVELSQVLDDASPLPPAERDLLRQMVDRMIDPYRRTMRARRSVG